MLADIYILANPRSAALVHRFLDRFLPDRVPAAAEYEVPRYADRPKMVLTNAADLIRLCEAWPELAHAVYWNNRDLVGEPRAAHVFFLRDGGLMLGLSTARRESAEQDRLLDETRGFVSGGPGYIAYEQPPVRTCAEFRRLATSLV
jgi:hypothetical protein